MKQEKGYTEMKDSGVEWISQIPTDWQVKKLKEQFSFGKGLPITKADLVDSGVAVISYGQIHAKSNTGTHLAESLLRYVPKTFLETNPSAILRKGDIVLADTSEDLDGLGNAVLMDIDETVFAGYHTIILHPSKADFSKYLSYLFQTDNWRSQLRANASGIKVFSVTQKMLRSCSFILPPKSVRDAITTYLDTQCAKIDEIIAQAKASIEDYKQWKASIIYEAVTKGLDPNVEMKESGVEWIPLLPTTVKLSRVGMHFSITLGKMLCPKPLDDNYTLEPYFCAANVHFSGVDSENLKEMWFNSDEKERYKVAPGDLLVVEGGAGAGGCAVIETVDFPVYVQNSIMIVRPKSKNNVKYLKYFIEALVGRGYVDFACNKATIPHFTKEKLSAVPFPIFDGETQGRIVDFLDSKCGRIDDLIFQKQSLIDDLESYKKSVIYEVVTGKRRVQQ